MSIDTHEEPWLREALDGLVSGEPSMTSTLVDDVRRGEAARTAVRRQRLVVVAVAAVLALVAVPAGLLLRAQPHAAAPPAASISATPGTAAETLRQRATVWLAAAGWTVLTQIEPTITDGTGRTEIDLGVARSADVAAGGTDSASLRVVSYPSSGGPGYYLATCTNESCPEAQQVAATTSCTGRPDCFVEAGAYPRAVGGTLGWGSLVLDRHYESGVLVELVVDTDYGTPTPATGTPPGAFLPLADARSLLGSIGNPYAAAPVPSQSPAPIPSPTGDGFVPDADWEAGAIGAFSGGITTVFQHADLTAARLSVSGREAEGDGGRFVMVSVDQGSTAAVQLASPPCGIDDPTCRVLLPWGRVTTLQGPAWISVVDVSFTDPVHRTRVASVVRGDTTVMLSSDSREVSTDFAYGASTAPGLSPDIIIDRALAIPVPESMRVAAGRPMATPPDTSSSQGGSASASADPGVATLPVCDVASLYITVGPATGVAAGQQAFAVHLSHNGGEDCQLPGSLSFGLTASDTTDVTPVGGGQQPGSGAASPLRLAPGSRAVVTVSATRCTGVVTAKTTFMSFQLGPQAGGVVVPREVALDYCDGAAAPGSSAVHVSPPVLEQ